MFFAATAIIAFMAITVRVWLRCDDLMDRIEETRPGRVRRSLVRAFGATVGWWLICVGLVLTALHATVHATGPFFALGLMLTIAAVVSKRRNDAPVFWAAP